jgi:hypothetical protein
VEGIDMHHIQVQKATDAPCLVLKHVTDIGVERVQHVKDVQIDRADDRTL